MDAISLLEKDHREVKALFKRFERLGDAAYVEKRRIIDEVIKALSQHAVVEEQFLYPAVRERIENKEYLALEALEEHHVVKWLLLELDKLSPKHERFDAKVSVLMESVRHHVEEEEGEMFPAMRRAFSKDELEDLGYIMGEMKKVAPTRPHPRAPDEPPANFVAGAMSAVLDRGRDLLSGERRAPKQASARMAKASKKKK